MPLRPLRAAACAVLLVFAACSPDLATNATTVPAGPLQAVLTETSATVVSRAYATGINNAGVMVGTYWEHGFTRGVVWSPAGSDTLQGLPRSPTPDIALSINDAGRIVGMANDSVYQQRPVVWASASAAPVVLPDLGAGGQATDINRGGMIAGWVRPWDFVPHAAVWTAEGTLIDLDPAGTGSRALAVNDSGVVVGVIRPGRNRAFRWTRETGMQLLPIGGDSSVAQDVNTRGEVVGTLWTAGKQRAYVWSPRTGLRDLGTLGASRAMGVAINDAGMVVVHTGVGDERGAVVWTARSGARVLDAGPYGGPVIPVAINRRGQVAGARTGADGEPEMVLWTVAEVNTRPSLAFPAPSITVYEGDTVALDVAATDAEGDALSYNWSFGDGTSLSVPATTAAPAVRRHWNDDGAYTVRVIAIDPSATRDTATLAVTVLNRAPAATFASPAYGYEGRTYVLSVSGLRDGAADVRAGIQASFDCGAGYGAWAVATRAACPAVLDDDTLQIGVRLRDKDGAVTEHRRAFVVYDAQPVVAAVAVTATTVAPGELFTARGQFSDAGRRDAPWLVRYFWGDGTVSTTTVSEQGWVPPMARAYARPGTYSVVVYVTDKDGRNGKSAPITVTVQ